MSAEEIRRRLDNVVWRYAPQAPEVVREMERRIADVARGRGLITYSDLVRGIEFQLASVNGGRPFRIEDWTENERAIVGDFLGSLNAETYRRSGIFVSALVVLKTGDRTPGPGFTRFMMEIGALRSRSEEAVFWASEVRRAHDHYRAQPSSSV